MSYRVVLWGLLFICLWFNVNTLHAQIKIMPLGNSLTAGLAEHGSDPVGGYRDDLYDLLTTEGVYFDFVGSQSDGSFADPNHEGHPGWHADSLAMHLHTWLSAYSPEVVLLMAGTNDVLSAQSISGIIGDIENLVDIIYNDDPNTKIVLSSLIPRQDKYDIKTDSVNAGILEMYYNKLSNNYKIYYAGHNEMFKARSDWQSALISAEDYIHPNNEGYAVMAEVFYSAVMNAINDSYPIVIDNFNRNTLGLVWDAPSNYLLVNGELSNTATDLGWNYLATYKALTNPTMVSMRIGNSADALGITECGLALMLDAPSRLASGYFLRITDLGEMDLWTIDNGSIGPKVATIDGAQGTLDTTDVFKVSIATDGNGHHFDCYENDEFIGRISDPNKLQGNALPQYAGIMLRGGRNNNVDDFNLFKSTDKIAPETITDLTTSSASATTIMLAWTAPGDDGSSGTALGYDIRYSTGIITESNFGQAIQVPNPPLPLSAGSIQTFVVAGLQPNTKYYFAMKAYDEVPNMSGLSNMAQDVTSNATEVRDNFERAELGPDWVAGPEFQIVNGELSNTSSTEDWNFLAVFKKRKNPIETKMKWGSSANAQGIDQGGLALMLTEPNLNANGYLAWRRTGSTQQIYLWGIENGGLTGGALEIVNALQPAPGPGDEFKAIVRIDENGHHFDFYINGEFDGTISDPQKLYANGDEELYAGVMLHGNRNNNVDEFAIINAIGEASYIEKYTGDGQDGAVGRALPESLAVKVTDENGNPVSGVKVTYQVTAGGGHFDLAVASDNHIRIEAEDGLISSPMMIDISAECANGQYIATPSGAEPYQGSAEYRFYIETAGDYWIWARVFANNHYNKNSWFVTMDQGEILIFDTDYSLDYWYWDIVSHRGKSTHERDPQYDPWTFTLNPGWHTLLFQNMNAEAQLDKIIIVNDQSWMPSGRDDLQIYPEYKTDALGLANAQWTMGPSVGINTAVVTAPGLQGSPITFTANASGDIPSALSFVSGGGQEGPGGEQLPDPFVAQVTDQYGNPKHNFPVHFVSISGGGSFVEAQPVHTDDNGFASAHFILGTESPNSVAEARAEYEESPLSGSPVQFTATATTHIASTLHYVDGNNQSGQVTTILTKQFKVKVEDDQGHVIKNHAVRFAIVNGPGGSKFSDYGTTEQIVMTGTDGIAKISYQFGTIADTNRIQAHASRAGGPLINSPVIFVCRATPITASKIDIVSGNNQTGAAGSRLAKPLVVKVTDEYGNGVAGHSVLFSVTAGGGSIEGKNSKTVHTNGNGHASVILTLGSDSEIKNKVEATASGNLGNPLQGSPVTFEATPGQVSAIEYVGGNNQKGSAGWSLSAPFSVRVLDNYKNPVPGFGLHYTVKKGSGTFNSATDTVIVSDASGIAKGYFTLGDTPGAENIVEVNGYRHGVSLSGNPITFKATAHPVTQILYEGKKDFIGITGLPLADSMKARVTDDQGVGLRNFPIKFVITEGGGNFDGDSQKEVLTNSHGVAAVQWTLGTSPGNFNNKAEAHATFNGKPLTFSPRLYRATAKIGPPTVLHIVQGDSQMAVVGGQLETPIKVRVTDAVGNPTIGHKITFSVIKGDGKINNAVPLTDQYSDPNGYAQVYWTIGNKKGDYNNELEVVSQDEGNHLVNSPHIFYASGMPSPATKLKRISSETINGPVGAPLPQPFKVQVTDNPGNGVSGVSVTFEGTAGGGTLDGETDTMLVKTSDENGFCETYLTVGPKNGVLNTVKVTAFNASVPLQNTPMYFHSTGQTGALSLEASTITFSPNLPAVGTEATIEITTTDAFGNPIRNKYVTIESLDEGTLIQPTAPTGNDGKTYGKIRAYKAGVKQIYANIIGNGRFVHPGKVTFIALLGSKIGRISGNNQMGNIGAALPEPLGVLVVDKYDNPVQNHEVTFYDDGEPDGNDIYEPPPSTTDSTGWAYSHLILKQMPGQNTASVIATDISGSRSYTATGVKGQAADIMKESGDNQEGKAGVQLDQPLVVKVVDSHGWPVWNHPVEFHIEVGNGSFNGAKSISVYSDKLGYASVYFTPDKEIGLNILRAKSLEKSLTFTINGVQGEAKKLLYIAGAEQEGPVYGSPPRRLHVRTTDFYDNGIGGVEVSFRVVSGEATIQESQPYISNENGDAFATMRFGGTVGEVIVEASSEGLINSPIRFKIYATSASAVTMEIAGGNGQQGTKARKLPFPFGVRALDSHGNLVKNTPFTWVVMSGNGTWLDGSTNMQTFSDENGAAKNWLVIGSNVGPNMVYVINQNLKNSPLEFTAEGVNNNFPVIEPEIGDRNIEEGEYLEIIVKATDDDDDVLTYGVQKGTIPKGAIFDSVGTQKFTWTASYTQAGNYTVWFLVRDSKGGIGAEEVNINVKNVNRKPILEAYWPTVSDVSGSTEDNDPLQFSVSVSDPDDEPLLYRWYLKRLRRHDSLLVCTDREYTFMPADYSLGAYSLSVIITDTYDTLRYEWTLHNKVLVELANFSAEIIENGKVKLTWETSFEKNNYGFNILRSNSKEGNYRQINGSLIGAADEMTYQFVDKKAQVGRTYYYKLEDVDLSGKKNMHRSIRVHVEKPTTFELFQNYPNPFNPVTKIRYQLPEATDVCLSIYNLLGQRIRTLVDWHQEAGYHIVMWDGKDENGSKVASSIYLYHIQAGDFRETRRMVLLK